MGDRRLKHLTKDADYTSLLTANVKLPGAYEDPGNKIENGNWGCTSAWNYSGIALTQFQNRLFSQEISDLLKYAARPGVKTVSPTASIFNLNTGLLSQSLLYPTVCKSKIK